MKGSKVKFLLLVVTFLLPISIFLFLKLFGKNQFAVEPLFQQNVSAVSENCNISYTAPYVIPDSILAAYFAVGAADQLHILSFNDANANDLQRAEEAMEADPVHFTYFVSDHDTPHNSVRKSVVLSNDRLQFSKQCIFLLKEPFNTVVVDRSGTIRGQYASSDREEVDRMITEITIILKKY